MIIGNIERATEKHYPEGKAIFIYACGCNLRCSYCGYAGLLGNCDASGTHDWDYAKAYISKRRERIEAVIFSGGEPTLQTDLKERLQEVKDMGLSTRLETNGTQPEILRDILTAGLVDHVAMDVKAPLDNYPSVVGCRIDRIRTSVWVIKQSGVAHEFRTTVVPGLHTTRELKAISELIHGAECYVVQDFISSNPRKGELRGVPAFPHKPLEDIRQYVERRVRSYQIRHVDEAQQMPVVRRRMRSKPIAAP